MTPIGPAPNERLGDWLDDLAGFGADARYLVSLGKDAYLLTPPRVASYGMRASGC